MLLPTRRCNETDFHVMDVLLDGMRDGMPWDVIGDIRFGFESWVLLY